MRNIPLEKMPILSDTRLSHKAGLLFVAGTQHLLPDLILRSPDLLWLDTDLLRRSKETACRQSLQIQGQARCLAVAQTVQMPARPSLPVSQPLR